MGGGGSDVPPQRVARRHRDTSHPRPALVATLIRAAAASDVAGCAALLGQLGYPATPESLARRLSILLPRDDYALRVAQHDAALVGLAAVHVFPAIHSDRPLAFIAALVVAEAQRGTGIGARLVAELEAFATRNGCDRIIVTTANHREGAHRFYDRLGYEFTGRRYAKSLI